MASWVDKAKKVKTCKEANELRKALFKAMWVKKGNKKVRVVTNDIRQALKILGQNFPISQCSKRKKPKK